MASLRMLRSVPAAGPWDGRPPSTRPCRSAYGPDELLLSGESAALTDELLLSGESAASTDELLLSGESAALTDEPLLPGEAQRRAFSSSTRSWSMSRRSRIGRRRCPLWTIRTKA